MKRWWLPALAFASISGGVIAACVRRDRIRNRHSAALDAEIARRRRAEDELRVTQARYRGVVEDEAEMICRLLPDGTYTFVNGPYCRYLDRRLEELIGNKLWQFLPSSEQAAARVALESISVDHPVSTSEHGVVAANGERRVQQWTDRGLFDPEGRLLEYQCVGRDVTDRVRAEDAHRQLVAQRVVEKALRQADQRKNNFLAMLAHELRNPLAPVTLAAEILRAAPPADPRTTWARDVIARQVRQMTRLVDDLMDVSRITRGKLILRKELVDLRTVVAQSVETIRPLVDKRGQELTMSLPEAAILVDGDPARLSQVVSNLLHNAAKYSDAGGRIDVELRRETGADLGVISIRDTGVGISAEMLPRIFELFTQVESRRESSAGGLGIGLSLARRLVELHGGTVQAASAGVGLGSEFSVGLPLAARHRLAAGSDAPPQGEPLVASTEGLRVLVADESVDAADGLAELLAIWRHTTRIVHDGQAALEAAEQFAPDVVLLELALPKVSGLEVARRLRARHGASSPVLVAITGYGQPADERRSAEVGIDHHLVKPVTPERLREVLARVPSRAAGR